MSYDVSWQRPLRVIPGLAHSNPLHVCPVEKPPALLGFVSTVYSSMVVGMDPAGNMVTASQQAISHHSLVIALDEVPWMMALLLLPMAWFSWHV